MHCCLPGRHPVTLYIWGHLYSNSGSIVEVLQHVLALGVFDQPAKGFLQGEPAGRPIWVVKRGSFSPSCESKKETWGSAQMRFNYCRSHLVASLLSLFFNNQVESLHGNPSWWKKCKDRYDRLNHWIDAVHVTQQCLDLGYSHYWGSTKH